MQAGDVLLGKFRIERVLGRGGMGEVVAARHVELDELFAVKLMHEEALSNPEAIERFIREARTAARLKGEHVARVHDVGRLENGAPYMLMEHLTGDDLSQLLDKRGALPVGEAALYVMQACEAIAEAHGQGIVHRDLKPANLFLTSRANGSPCVKVLDFGISKKIDPSMKHGRSLTVTGAFMGSPAFMSPEQMLNVKSADTRTDIWALGTILYELTTGAVPFDGETMTELVAKVMNEPATPPSVLRPAIPQTFDNVVLKCLEKRPAHRFQTIEDLMAALRPFTREDNPQPIKAMPAVMRLPRVHDDTDSERATEIVNAQTLEVVPIAGVARIDNGPDSNAATRVFQPSHPALDRQSLPSAMDADFFNSTGNTVEMPTQIHQPSALSRPAAVQTPVPLNKPTTRKASNSRRIVLLGLVIFSVMILAALLVTLLSETPPVVDKGVNSQNAVNSAAPEVTIKPVVSSESSDVVPVTSAVPSAKPETSTKQTLKSPAPKPAPRPKATLY